MQFLCHLFIVPGLETEPPVMGSHAERGNQSKNKKLHEPKTGKLHQSQQPRQSLGTSLKFLRGDKAIVVEVITANTIGFLSRFQGCFSFYA